MKCQKNRVCKKQPGDAPPFPDGTKLCTGCDKLGKDKGAKGNVKTPQPTFDLVGMTENQVQLVADALEFFSRIGCGQFDFIPSQMSIFDLLKHHDGRTIEWEEVRQLCNGLKRCIGLTPNAHYGIGHPKVHKCFKSSYDIYKIIMHNLMKRRDPEKKHYNVHTDPPLFVSGDRSWPELRCSQPIKE